MERDQWASDAPVSAPLPNDRLESMMLVDLGGMVFTPGGIALPVTTALHDQRYSAHWSPQMEADRGRSS